MKIVFVNRHPDDIVGGSEIQCEALAAKMAQKGYDVTYVAPAGSNRNYGKNYRVMPVASNAASISKAIIDAKPDIVYWRFNKYYFHLTARKIAKQKIPIVFAVSHVNDTRVWSHRENIRAGFKSALKAIKQGILTTWNHLGFRYVDGITVINPDHLNILPISAQRFVPNAITENLIPFSWPRPYIVWVSNIKPAKRPELFIDLAKTYEQHGIDFLMIGDIQASDYDWIKDHTKIPSNFHFLGSKSLEEINGIIASALFLVHTCKPEGFGSVFLQAWLQSKATVTYEFDPGHYIQAQGLGGAANNNWNNFTSVVQGLIKNSSLRNDAGARARQFAIKTFSAEESTNKLEKFLLQVKQNHNEKNK